MSHSLEHGSVIKAAAWLLLGVLGGLGLDLCAKKLLETYSLLQFVFLRSGIGILILLAIAPRFGGLAALRTQEKGWHFLRTLLAIGAMFGFFYGLARMPLVNALTLGYTAPLMVTMLSALFLGDKVGWRRWSAVLAGFVGVVIVLRPGRSALTFAEVAVLIAAFCYACQAITARRLSATESTLALSFWVIVGPLVVAAATIDGGDWSTPDLMGWLLIVSAAAASVIAWFGFVNGYRAVSPATLAPLEYVAIVLGAVAGYLLWDEVPDRWVVAGALLIIASSIFVVYRSEAANDET
jgi:drug/metabolite transporter (DMT)-like permease